MSGPTRHATLDDCDVAKAVIKAAAAWVSVVHSLQSTMESCP